MKLLNLPDIIQPLKIKIMGKGDKKTKRGKLFQGSFGVRRRKKGDKVSLSGKSTVAVETAKEVKEVKEVKETKEVKTPHPKTTKSAPAAKKEPKPRKQESA